MAPALGACEHLLEELSPLSRLYEKMYHFDDALDELVGTEIRSWER